jgi:hypothetical protein
VWSYINCVFAVTQLIDKHREHNISIFITFVDYTKNIVGENGIRGLSKAPYNTEKSLSMGIRSKESFYTR